jgi:hypothetical protein
MKVMLDRANMSPAILVGEIGETQALLEILHGRLLFRTDIREELHAEFHHALLDSESMI